MLTNRTIETLDFSDDVTEEELPIDQPVEEQTDPITERAKQFTFCIQITCPKINSEIWSKSAKLSVSINSLHVTLDDQQKHRQVKLMTSGVYCSSDKGVLFTTDGRGCLPSIGTQVDRRTRDETRTVRGIEIVWTQAETKHWRQREEIQATNHNDQTKNLKLSRFITELSATVGPVDLVLDMNVIFGLVELTQLLPKSTQQRSNRPKAPMKIPLLHVELQDTVVFFPVES